MDNEIMVFDSTQKRGVRHVEKHKENPFMDSLIVKTRSKRLTVARGSTMVDINTGEIEGVTEIAQVISVDEDQFIKLFTKDLAIWFDLNKSGMRVFAALLTVIQKEAIRRDLVYLDRTDEAIEEFKIQKTTFFNGIEELLAKGFIARHVSSGWYFINPTMFFNGDRARFVKEYRKEKIPNRAIQIDLFDKQKSIL